MQAAKNLDLYIAGEINLDLILYGLPMDMPTERELLSNRFVTTLGASSAIVAHNAASLGLRVGFVTATGDDDLGRLAVERLRDAGVVVEAKVLQGKQTGVTIVLPHEVERHMMTYPGTMESLHIADLDLQKICQARHFHLSSLYLQKGLHNGLIELVLSIKQAGLTISLDTNDDPANIWGAPLPELLPLVDVFLPNESEVCRMTGTTNVEEALDRLPAAISLVAVKRGARGARLRTSAGRFDVSPLQVTPVDTLGAGDSFDAGFLAAYLQGLSPEECARAGNITGALSTQAAGGTEAFRDEALREGFLRSTSFPYFSKVEAL